MRRGGWITGLATMLPFIAAGVVLAMLMEMPEPAVSAFECLTGRERLFPVLIDGKVGYISRDGRLAIPAKYEPFEEIDIDGVTSCTPPIYHSGNRGIRWAKEFSGGRCFVKIDGKYTIIDTQGREVSDVRYESVNESSPPCRRDYLPSVRSPKVSPSYSRPRRSWRADVLVDPRQMLVVTRAGKQGMVRRDGRVVLPPVFDRVSGPSLDGLVHVQRGTEQGVYNANSGGRMVLPLSSQKINVLDLLDKGHWILVERNGKKGVVDSAGRWVVPLKARSVWPRDGGGCTVNEPDGGWSLYDDPGRVVYRGNPGTRFACQAGPGLIILYESKTRRKYLVNLDLGRRVTEWEWGRHGGIGSYGEGLVPLKVEGKWGYIDRRGHTVIAPAFAGAGPFRGGLAKVCKDGGWGFIDRSGRQVVGCRFTWVDDFIDGLAIVRTQPNRFGVIDRTGKFVIKPAYLQLKMLTCSQRRPSDSAGPFGRSSCDVLAKAGRMMDPKGPRLFVASKTYGTCGLIDATGAVMCPFFLSSDNLLDEGLVFSEGLAMVVRKTPDGPKVGFVDPTGRIAIRPRFDYAEDFSGGLSRVTVGSSAENICGLQDPNSARWGYIDRKGRVVWEPTR